MATSGRMDPTKRKTLRQFSLSPIVQEFLDTLGRGEMSNFVESRIVSSQEYVNWEAERMMIEKEKAAETQRSE